MDRYNQHNNRGNNYGRDYENRNNRRNEQGDHNLSNYLSRYQQGGNYYGMPDTNEEYENVRVSNGRNSGGSSSGPSQRSSSNYNAYSGNSDRNSYGSGRNENRQNNNYGGGGYQRNQEDHYRYGDPNSHMNNSRNSGYDRSRGTGWRSESDDSRRGSTDYSRQDNSYQYSGSGRRYNEFGRDERSNYGRDEELTDIHRDRGEHTRRREDNNYGNQDYRRNDRDRDNYATGMYSSNRAYLADQGQDRDEGLFDRTSDDYPNRSPRGYGQRSGPDYTADSPISNYRRGADRG